MIKTMIMAVKAASMPEPDAAAWRALGDLTAPDHLMKQADFYYREGHVVAVGRVPL